MGPRLTPRKNSFYDMFAASAANLVVGVKLLTELLGAAPSERPAISERMKAAEHASDEITHGIMREVNSSFITPFDREDIYRLASSLDDVTDAIEAAVDLVVLYNVGELPGGMADQVEVLERAAEITAEAMPRLKVMKNLREYWIEINRLENAGDQIYRRLLAKLYSGEYDALTVLKLKEVVEQLEAAADAFENVANTVESIAVKES
jgi:predicted phosphate transport protein (TIGR00153 family)